ncbi:MAG: hypothetical protein E5Y38_14910 [Mesorhizobium sp.]|uniref:hypothetical protein n=1 Tax=Mesorhizobium sp. TaxID=1871066 RepID=UPI001206CB77|nr:hypothetical protein [Mesorhizobium sp.]TIM99998.1 MAG: hypothetical protein E5Y38_14910 [Mesorhizobium sp.]
MPDAEEAIRENLVRLQKGSKAPLIAIGNFTETQFAEINSGRAAFKLHALEEKRDSLYRKASLREPIKGRLHH